METPQTPPRGTQLQIKLDDATAQGAYVNLALVQHTESEFIIDFIFVQPQQPVGTIRARIITSPQHTKRLTQALQENLRKYEEKFGEVKVAPPPPDGHVIN